MDSFSHGHGQPLQTPDQWNGQIGNTAELDIFCFKLALDSNLPVDIWLRPRICEDKL